MKKIGCTSCKGNCEFCIYADVYNYYLDVAPYDQYQFKTDTASMELCKGRHETPATDGAIFETEVNPLDVTALESQAKERLVSLNITRLHLYVTGLTVALIAVLNVTRELGIEVILWHFDRESGQYYSQEVR